MASGQKQYEIGILSSKGARKDCTHVSLEFSIVLLRDESDGMQGCASIMRDVTDRWKKEKELKERLTLCEIKTT